MVATRIAVVVLVDISAFPAINQRYLIAVYPLLCMASVLGIAGPGAAIPVRGARRDDWLPRMDSRGSVTSAD
ncbi:MAG: hypothetical protein IPJ62_20990 [Betaproteobacteria bacterium]|nr:hypothetical protein [Betaproteobacteria bacterium]